MQKDKLQSLATERNTPCVTLSMNTHRTYPGSDQDMIVFKNLLTKLKEEVINQFGKRSTADLLKNIDQAEKKIDFNYNLDSLHLFLSNSTNEIIKSPWPTPENTFFVGESFAIKPIIKVVSRTEEYLILLLSQSGVRLLHAVNDTIVEEIDNGDFPFTENPHYLVDTDKMSDGKQVDNMILEFYNKIDKAVVKIYHKTGMNCVVICTEDNYSKLMQVADKPIIYYGFSQIVNTNNKNSIPVLQAWRIVNAVQKRRTADAIKEMQEAVGQGKVLTELSEIYDAVKEGRGDLLIIHDDFHQSANLTEQPSLQQADVNKQPGAMDDAISDIAWEVISKKGRTIFTSGEEIKVPGDIALKVRY